MAIPSHFTDEETETQDHVEPTAAPQSPTQRRNPRVTDVLYNGCVSERKKPKPSGAALCIGLPPSPASLHPHRAGSGGEGCGECDGPSPGRAALAFLPLFPVIQWGPLTSIQARACGQGSELQDPRDWELADLSSHRTRESPAPSSEHSVTLGRRFRSWGT